MDFDLEVLGKNIRKHRKNMSLTQLELAKILDISTSTIGMYEQGRRTPPIDSLVKLAATFDIDLQELTHSGNLMEEKKEVYDEYQRVPIVGTIAAGYPILAVENIEGYFPMDVNSGADFALKVKGDSMIEAGINEGDIVFIKKQSELNNRDIGAFLVDDEATLKRFHKDDDSITLIPANQAYDLIRFDKDEIENNITRVKVLGKMVGLYSTRSR